MGLDAGFNVIKKRDPGNRHFEAPRSGISDGEKIKINSTFAFGNDGNDRKSTSRTVNSLVSDYDKVIAGRRWLLKRKIKKISPNLTG